MKTGLSILTLFISTSVFAGDTTSTSYRVGYAMGEFLPFIVVAVIFIWLMWKRYNASR